MAEVLITLGIIGIVAAMTMPSLIAKTKEKEAVSQLKKVHSTLENAFRLAQNEHSEISNWFTTNNQIINSELFYNNLKPYLKVSKDCGFGEGCFTPGMLKSLRGPDYANYDKATGEYRVILADGTALMFYLDQPQGVFDGEIEGIPIHTESYGNIKVDIDGKKGEYTWGKDVFVFLITNKGIIPQGLPNDTGYKFQDFCNISKSFRSNGLGCAAWVIYNENMDYLHCSDLSWDGKKKCK